MRYLVTGSAGFIGHALSHRLLARGDAVVGIDSLNAYYDPALKHARTSDLAATSDLFQFKQVDFADQTALDAALAGEAFNAIIHLGAQPGVRYSLENPQAYIQSNIVGHLNLLELARARQVAMVYASSSSVYGGNISVPFCVEDRVDHPVSLYAATKRADELMSETYAHLYRIPLTGLRFFTVYGPWGRPDMAPWLFTSAILEGRPIRVFNHGQLSRDFTYIDDIVSGIIACVDNRPPDDGKPKAGGSTAPHRIYNIGNNKPEPLMDFIAQIEAATGKRAVMEMTDMQPGDVAQTWADIDAIASELGYAPTTPISVGIPRFVEWYKEWQSR